MLHLFTGTDRELVRKKLNAAVAKAAGKHGVVRISDANSRADLETSFEGAGMFGEKRVVVLENVLANEEMHEILLAALPRLRDSEERFFIFEEKPDAATRRTLEKYAETSERFDISNRSRERGNTIFALANALKRGDKKALWVAYQRELAGGNEPEAIHGVLFWGAKQMFLSTRVDNAEHRRSARLIAELAELPHASRRRGVEIEYALERFLLSGV
jgi:DNA polymerase III delta subunit